MSNRTRELLERAIEEWDSNRDLYEFHKVMEEIRAYLAEPEVKREPLTQEEATKIFKQIFGGAYPCMADDMKMVRAVENHHRIEKLK